MDKDLTDIQIVFIGAGNLATHLAKALFGKGYRIVQVFSRTGDSAKSLADKVDAGWTTCLESVVRNAQLYIVSLKDAAFIELLPRIVAGKEDALWVHTAGSIPLNVWQGKVSHYGVLYPLQTFSKYREVDFSNIPFFVESADPDDTELLTGIASSLSGKVYEVDSRQRSILHLAAVFACNFTNHMYALATELLEKHGLPFQALLPLIDETARKVHELSPFDAQTGPAVRYDNNVIDRHLQMLTDEPVMKEIYQLLSASIYRSSQEKHNR